MELFNINNLKDGQSLAGEKFKVLSRENKTFSTGKKATVYNLADENNNQIQGKVWNKHIEEDYHILQVLEGRVGKFRERLEININSCEGYRIDHENAEIDSQTRSYYEEVLGLIEEIEDPEYKTIVKTLYNKYSEEILNIPAGYKMHHNYRGGLIEHIWEVTTISRSFKEGFPLVNKDLLISGGLLHDIGKVKTLGIDGFEATIDEEAHIFDHLYIGTEMLKDTVRELGLNISKDKLYLLVNIIGSHHNKLEYGAIFRPCCMEAYFIYLADVASSKYNRYKNEWEGAGRPELFRYFLDDSYATMYGVDRVEEIMKK